MTKDQHEFIDNIELTEVDKQFIKDFEKILDETDPLLSCIIDLRSFAISFDRFGIFPRTKERIYELIGLLNKVRNDVMDKAQSGDEE